MSEFTDTRSLSLSLSLSLSSSPIPSNGILDCAPYQRGTRYPRAIRGAPLSRSRAFRRDNLFFFSCFLNRYFSFFLFSTRVDLLKFSCYFQNQVLMNIAQLVIYIHIKQVLGAQSSRNDCHPHGVRAFSP